MIQGALVVGAALLGAAVAAGCSSADKSSGFQNGDAGGGFGNGDGGTGGGLGGEGGTGVGADGCSDAAKLVYVVDSHNGLHSFDPAALEFHSIGTLHCNTDSSPNSMAVDRSGTAWVNFADGEVFKVSTTDASCTATSFDPSDNPNGGEHWGMAFSTNSAGSTDETLWVDPGSGAGTGRGLYKFDTSAYKLTKVGDFTNGLDGEEAELTGTGDARLFGFLTTSPATVAEIDKSSGATPTSGQSPLAGVETGQAWAFSFWGGDFWLYTSDDGLSSSVTQYHTSSSKATTVVIDDTGFAIVGAGVSTCAPTVPPR
ncbi:MAG TPA: hypothetical protein VF407_07910 [Polyangiaceae bacterium]